MNLTFSAYLSCLSTGIAVLLLFAAVRFIYREKYAQAFLKLPDARIERVIWYDRLYVRIFKMLLWPMLLLLILMPFTLFFLYNRETFVAGSVLMVLGSIGFLQEYQFRKWFLNYLETQRNPQSAVQATPVGK